MSVPKSTTRHAGEGGLRPFTGPPGAACSRQRRQPSHLPTPSVPGGGRFRSRHQFATARGSNLHAPPRPLRLAHRIRDPDDRPTFLRSVLTVPLHHYRYNSSNIPSIRKNLQVTSHARRKEVFASRAGDLNILGPSTPCNLQHLRQRLLELGQRHPSPEGCARPHQLHSKTIGDPQSPHCSTYFSLLRGWGGLLRRAFLSHGHWSLPAAVDSVIPRIAAVRPAIQLEDPIQANVGSTDIPTPQGLRPRHITPHNTCSPVFCFTHECGGIPAMQIQREGWTSHSLPTQGGHLARAYFAQQSRPLLMRAAHRRAPSSASSSATSNCGYTT
jgi:hypothetical protein